MAVKMKRLWGRILQLLLAVMVVLYLGDWIALRVRAQTQASSTVQVQQFLRTPLKGQKEEFDYMGTVDQPCVHSLFPHNSETPCWWLERHKIRWVSP
jgi:nitrate/nitrite-specific signal transduction histidine kinase